MKKLTHLLFILCSFLSFNGLYAEGETTMPSTEQGFGQTLVMIAIAMIFFYIILWRPEQKRRKELEAQRSQMKKGDKVTAMGIIGTIVRIQDNSVILRMVDGSKIEVLKAAISDVLPGSEEDEKRAEKEERSSSKSVNINDVE